MYGESQTRHRIPFSDDTFPMITSQNEFASKSGKESAKPSSLAFDVQWLLGEKSDPDPLPDREEIRVRSRIRKPRHRGMPLNLLATVFVLGSIGTIGLLVATQGLTGIVPGGMFESMPWVADGAKDSPSGNEGAISPESEREANETIEAILALQELAAQSDGKSTQTQKR